MKETRKRGKCLKAKKSEGMRGQKPTRQGEKKTEQTALEQKKPRKKEKETPLEQIIKRRKQKRNLKMERNAR
jgi:hypothetical protein